jgi:hypothetical protein
VDSKGVQYFDYEYKREGVDWQFTTTDARVKLKRLYPTNLT